MLIFPFQNVVLRSTPLRNDFVYYYVYYMTLNTFFATILPIGALFFFSFSTLRGLHSIRHYFKSSSIPLRCSSSKKSARCDYSAMMCISYIIYVFLEKYFFTDELGFTVFTPRTPQTPSGAQRVKTKSYLWKSFLLGI